MKRACLVLLAGCTLYFDDHKPVPQPPIDPPPPPTAEQEFDANVAPILEAKCAGCHVGAGPEAMLGANDTASAMYQAIVSNPELNGGWDPNRSGLLLKGQHEGPGLTSADDAAISQWLLDEAAARGVDPTQPDTVEAQWAACLTISKDLLLQTGASQIGTAKSDTGTCASCHGVGSFVLSSNVDAMLASWETRAGLEVMFQKQQQADGTFRMQLAEASLDDKGQERAQGTGTHPSYLLDATVIDGLDEFVALVQQRLDAGLCPAPLPSF